MSYFKTWMILTIQCKHITSIAMLHNKKCHYFKYPWYSIQFVKYSRVFWVVREPILCPGFLFIFKWIAISKRLSNSRAFFLELLTKAYSIWSMPVKCVISYLTKARCSNLCNKCYPEASKLKCGMKFHAQISSP